MATLYIFGNGFDLAHGLPSRFSDFKTFLESKGNAPIDDQNQGTHGTYSEMLKDIEKYFPKLKKTTDSTAWSNFEEALAWPDDEIRKAHDALSLGSYFQKRLSAAFSNWGRSLIDASAKPLFHFEPNSVFLTFNYTKTLEIYYEVADNRICHIHGDAFDYSMRGVKGFSRKEYSKIYFGHGNEKLNKGSEFVSALYKDAHSIFEFRKATIQTLISGVDKVICFGSSCSNIDASYFREIKKLIPNAEWKIGFHLPEERNDREAFAISLGFSKQTVNIDKLLLTKE